MIKVALSGSKEYKAKVISELSAYEDIKVVVSCHSADIVITSEIEYNNNMSGSNVTIANNKKIPIVLTRDEKDIYNQINTIISRCI